MNLQAVFRCPITVAALGLLVAAASGCAQSPAFQAVQPAEFASEGKAIAIIGDLQQTPGFVRMVRRRENNALEQQRLIADLKDRIDDLSALVVVGDLVYTARSRRHWAHFDELVRPFAAGMPVLPAIGNHDYPCYLVKICSKSRISSGMLARFPWFSPGQPYAVTSGDLRLLFLDSESGLDTQGEWLAGQLADAVGRYRAALVFFHRPAFSNSIDRGAEGSPDVQQYVVPRLEAAQLPLVAFSGHVHGLEYIVREGVHYVTTAGGGGPRGAMAAERPFDRYRGPDCPQPGGDEVFRPFNYLLLREGADELTIEIRGFCSGDAAISRLDTIDIPLQ
jgi:hypothetical protein